MENIYLDWEELKVIVAKGFRIDFKETKRGYQLFVIDRNNVTWVTNITIPSEITDFEDNYKADANAFTILDVDIITAPQIDVNVSDEATQLAKEPTQAEIRDTIGQESGETVLSKLDQIDNTLDEHLSAFPGLSVRRFLTNASSPDLNVDGSVTPVEFIAEPSPGKILYIHSISIVLEDPAINFTKFAGIPALTNGMDFKAKQNGLPEATLVNIKKNGEFYLFANEIILDSATTDIFTAHIKVKENTGTTIKLVDSNNDNVKVVINDNLTNIDTFHVLVFGYEVDE